MDDSRGRSGYIVVMQYETSPTADSFSARCKAGYSLLELSIVLMVIGLLVGGVLVGSHLISIAEVRSVITTIDNYRVGYNVFRDKYGCIPGDCVKATTYFQDVENGDGNGLIDCEYTASKPTCTAPTNEHVMAVKELQQAQLIPGESLTNLSSDNLVPTKLRNCMIQLYKNSMYQSQEQNVMRVYIPLGAAPWNGDCMTPSEASQIDTKLDDNNPSTGTVFGLRFQNSNQSACVSTNHWDPPSIDAEYMVNLDGVDCTSIARF